MKEEEEIKNKRSKIWFGSTLGQYDKVVDFLIRRNQSVRNGGNYRQNEHWAENETAAFTFVKHARKSRHGGEVG